MLSIQGSTTQWEIPSVMKTDAECFPFFMPPWQLTHKKLYNMIHKYWFYIKFIFALQDTPVHTEFENEPVG
jgi:hypothetical protein